MSDRLTQAIDLLLRCQDGFGAFINGRRLARKARDQLRRDIDVFLAGASVIPRNEYKQLLRLAADEIIHGPKCVPGKPCECGRGPLLDRINEVIG